MPMVICPEQKDLKQKQKRGLDENGKETSQKNETVEKMT